MLANCLRECGGEYVDGDGDIEADIALEIDDELLESERGMCLRFDCLIVMLYVCMYA